MTETNQTEQVPAQAKDFPLSTDVLTLIEARLANEKKSTLVAYLLWFFLGWFGVHQFYLGNTIAGILYIVFSVIGGATFHLGFGVILIGLVGLGWLVDLFRIPGLIQKHLARRREELIVKYRHNGAI